ncbi:MAG TPA: ABC transporter permease [Anaerolineae bacterium]|nr:ABC transporter permease [Anaerolineae bacterium]HQH37874.1 ABC transporter permease [Anaerolineae bacterium]
MRNIGLVIKNEIRNTIGKPSFWVTTFLLPALIMIFTFGAQFFSQRAIEQEEDVLADAGQDATLAIGYVDHAGLISRLPPGIPETFVRAFPDEETARAALLGGELREYYIIPADYIATGNLVAIEREFAPLGNIGSTDVFQYVISFNLVGDETIARRVANPIANVDTIALAAEGTNATADYGTRFLVGYGVLFIFYFVLTMSSSFMLRSVSQEKENQTVEVLLVSLRPRDLMLGKVLGLGAVALLQMAIWLGGSYLTLTRGGSALASFGIMVGNITLPQGFVVWGLLYFILGYILYASILGAIGALAPSARETGSFTFMVMVPMMLPLFLSNAFVETPNGLLATIVSLFPLTAPTSMLPRLAAGGVPLWQPLVGLVILAATAYLFVLVAARFFRADTLLSSASMSWQRVREEFKKGSQE